MNEPTLLARIMGSSLNTENEKARQMKTDEESTKKKKRRIPRAVKALRERDGLDPRDLVGQ